MPALANISGQPPAAQQTSRCALVLHGLNTDPDKMIELAQFSEKFGYKTRLGVLTGHHTRETAEDSQKKISAEQWQNDFTLDWAQAIQNCIADTSERLFIGYSLGALAALNYFDQDETKLLPTKMILIAPALAFRKKTALIRMLTWLPFGAIPSFNHPDYRAQAWTSLASYKALFELNAAWQKIAWQRIGKIPTLVVLAAQDELVDSQAVENEIRAHAADTWKSIWLSNEDSELHPRYFHLMIDSKSIGNAMWQKFTSDAANFLKKDFNGR